ncbi:MAG: hypothetical protein ACOC1K_06205 [Nanoarchaeota archaeon]
MNKKIIFSEKELEDLKTVLKIVEPEKGIRSSHLYRIYDVVFKKSYESELGFTKAGTMELIDADKCHIKIDNKKISAREITDELLDREIIKKIRIQEEDENGKKRYYSNDPNKSFPVHGTYYKVIY